MTDSKLSDEPARLAALHRYGLLDTVPETPLDRITALVKTVLDVPVVTISLVDANRLWFKSVQGITARETPRETSFCTHTIRARQPLIVPDAQADSRFMAFPAVAEAPHIRSYIGVPLETPDGYNIGSLCAMDVAPRAYSQSQIDLMQRFASLVSHELELRSITLTDQLTGAVSRQALLQEAERVLARFSRSQSPAALVLFDLDHFRLINDAHGHATGDQVLRSAVACCLSLVRESDVLGRVGGEEFALLLPDAGTEAAGIVAERIRSVLAELIIDTSPPLGVSASFGVAALSEGVTSALDWLKAAEAALQDAKRTGRNKVCSADAVDGS